MPCTTTRMRWAWGWGILIALAAACNTDEAIDAPEDGVGGSGGAGGSGGCTIDNFGSAGAVAISTVVPPAGSWCPNDGLEVCTDGDRGTFPGVLPDGGLNDPPPIG